MTGALERTILCLTQTILTVFVCRILHMYLANGGFGPPRSIASVHCLAVELAISSSSCIKETLYRPWPAEVILHRRFLKDSTRFTQDACQPFPSMLACPASVGSTLGERISLVVRLHRHRNDIVGKRHDIAFHISLGDAPLTSLVTSRE